MLKHRFIQSCFMLLLAVLVAFVSVAPAMATRRVEIGVATGATLLNIPDDQLQKRLQDIKRLGATWIRVDFSWTAIQPKNAKDFDFRFHDKVVVAAENLGLQVLATLGYTPAWARDLRCAQIVAKTEEAQQKCNPRDMNEFTRYANETAKRYQKHAVLAWEIWNEPNLTGYWKSVRPDGSIWVNPSSYGRLADAAARTIRSIKPTAIVMTGGMAPVFDPADPRGMRQGDFLRQMLPHLGRGGITAIAIHPYTWPAYPRHHADWNAFYTVDNGKPPYNLRQILLDAGRGWMTLWATEYGASTVGATSPSLDPAIPRKDVVDEAGQALMIKEGIEGWYIKPNVGPLFVYADSDEYLPTYRNEGGFGLRRRDGTAKPAYLTLQSTFLSTKTLLGGLAKQYSL